MNKGRQRQTSAKRKYIADAAESESYHRNVRYVICCGRAAGIEWWMSVVGVDGDSDDILSLQICLSHIAINPSSNLSAPRPPAFILRRVCEL